MWFLQNKYQQLTHIYNTQIAKRHNFAAMLRKILCSLLLLFTLSAAAQGIGSAAAQSVNSPDYQPGDSAEICEWLREAAALPKGESQVLWFGRKFLSRPYIAHTLERNKAERLVINTRELDCTTFTENVMALELCRRAGRTSFRDFCQYLRNLRYEKGRAIDYTTRNHYFTGWINSNVAYGYFTEIAQPEQIFSATQTVFVDYMTKHPNSYKMIRETPDYLPAIAEMEQRLSGGTYRYIPKAALRNTNTPELRNAIHDGDIVVILTNKPGLDTQHITIAHWVGDELHVMHASSIKKKVIDDPLSLYDYLQRQKTATGVRIVRMSR